MAEPGNRKRTGFILLPALARWARGGHLHIETGEVPDVFLALLPVLVCFENAATRLSFPGLRKLAALAGLSPTTASHVLTAMGQKEDGWWHVIKKSIGHGRTQHLYQMRYSCYDGTTPAGDWIRMSRSMVLGGVWAVMPPATRRIYITLRAHGQHEERAAGQWIPAEELAGTLSETVFVPADVALPSGYLMELTGYCARTVFSAREWLFDNGLAFVTEEGQAPGIIMPIDPGLEAPEVLEGVAAAQERDRQRGFAPARSGYAMRTLKRLREKRTDGQCRKRLVTAGTSGKDASSERQPPNGQAAASVAEQGS